MKTNYPRDHYSQCNCTICPLFTEKYVPMQRIISPQLSILWVGEAPGKTETFVKCPFVGGAGKFLWGMMKAVGFNQKAMNLTNACACRPPENRTPTLEELEFCRPRLKYEIHLTRPELIVALGEPALLTLTGEHAIRRHRGRFLSLGPEYEYDCKVLVLFHPSYIMRQRQWLSIALEEMNQANEFIMRGGVPPPPMVAEPELILDPTEPELVAYLSKSRKDFPNSFDIETTGLNPRKDKIIGISISHDVNSAVAFDLPLGDPRWWITKAWLEDKSIPKGTQNGQFDILFEENNNVVVQGLKRDSRLNEQLIHSDLPSDLDFLRAQYTKMAPYKPEKKKGTKVQISNISLWSKEDRLRYGALDAVCTQQVLVAQEKLLTPKQKELADTLLIPLVGVINRMEQKGVMIDLDMLRAFYARVFPTMDAIDKHLDETHGLNPRSPKQLMEFFGLKCTDEEHLLREIDRRHPLSSIMDMVLNYRKHHTIATTFLYGIWERLEGDHVHTSYKLDGTGTGRLSSRNPNLQNQPPTVRKMYVAEPGKLLIEADYSQIEIWTGAILSGKGQLYADLKARRDVHNELAKEIYQKDDISGYERRVAKTIVFGTMFGLSPRTIAIQYKITVADAEAWQNLCVGRYPELSDYRDRCDKDWKQYGFLETPFGRRRSFSDATQGYNFPIQSTASDIMLHSLLELDRKGFDIRLTVHDSVVIQCPDATGRVQVCAIKRIMERPIPAMGGASFPAKYKVGKNWLEMEEIK